MTLMSNVASEPQRDPAAEAHRSVANLLAAPQLRSPFCAQCGSLVSPRSRFCSTCGAPFGAEPAQVQAPRGDGSNYPRGLVFIAAVVLILLVGWFLLRSFLLSDAENLWCLGQPHANELQAAARAMSVDGSGWFHRYNSDLQFDPAFIKVCKAAYAADH